MKQNQEKEAEDFVTNSISRRDIDDIMGEGYSDRFTYTDMKQIARRMGDIILDTGFWDTMDIVISDMIERGLNK